MIFFVWRLLWPYPCLPQLVHPVLIVSISSLGSIASGHIAADEMPQTGLSYEGRRGGTRHNTCKANGQIPGTSLVNGAIVCSGYPAAANATTESTPVGTLNGTKPQCRVNGHINHGYKGRSRKAQPPRTHGKQGSMISAVADASTADRVSRAASPGGVHVNGATSPATVAPPCSHDQMAPEHSLSAAEKKQRGKKKCGHKKRPRLMPSHEEEDWENEIQEITLSDWESLCFGNSPYGPEDVLHFALRDMTLKQRETVPLPVTATYSPAIHHSRPVKWSRHNFPTEPDQFTDADE